MDRVRRYEIVNAHEKFSLVERLKATEDLKLVEESIWEMMQNYIWKCKILIFGIG